MALATKEDFAARHGALASGEEALVTALLEDASALIALEVPPAAWLAEDFEGDVPAGAKAICIQVAYRAWENPDGIAREQLGAMARTYRGTDQADALWLTKSEARLLRKAAGISSVQSVPVETPYSGDPVEGHPMDFFPLETEGS
jgi:hypothetical protein